MIRKDWKTQVHYAELKVVIYVYKSTCVIERMVLQAIRKASRKFNLCSTVLYERTVVNLADYYQTVDRRVLQIVFYTKCFPSMLFIVPANNDFIPFLCAISKIEQSVCLLLVACLQWFILAGNSIEGKEKHNEEKQKSGY